MKRVLFVCSQNRLRSPTAEAVFTDWPGVESLSAGLNRDAETPLSGDLVEWADVIAVMEPEHKRKLLHRFGSELRNKKLVVLDIPDDYAFMQPELVELLKERVRTRVGGIPGKC